VGTHTHELRQDIEQTRDELGRDVDALAEKVMPSRVAERQMRKVSGRMSSLKDSVMGTVGSAEDTVGEALDSAGDTIGSATHSAARTARGNPLAMGLLVLAGSWLASSLIPSTAAEERAAARAKQALAGSGLAEEAAGMVQGVKAGMGEAVHASAESLTSTTSEAVSHVVDDAKQSMPTPSAGGSGAHGPGSAQAGL
jgi:hypothetical protein